MKTVSQNRLVTAWTSVFTTSAIFLLIGFLIFYPPFPWWCAIVPAFTLVEAIRVTITYLSGEHTRICPNCQKETSISNQFCDKCGYDLRAASYQTYGTVSEPIEENFSRDSQKGSIESNKYCRTCGGPLGGSEAYCPTCGMPNPAGQK
ncbi:MAG: zinc ribbon domain-containing protein [Candidatus Lokiarchaeota archaeon]|nr:zinc ribbon domain-containing protein [Candidatus Lokiarchaeota archaeon]